MNEACRIVPYGRARRCRTCGSAWDPTLGETSPCDAARELRQAERARAAEAERARREAEAESYRDAEIRRALEIWEAGYRIAGTPAADYLAARGIVHVAGLRLRFVEAVAHLVATLGGIR